MNVRDGVVTLRKEKPPEEKSIRYDNLNGEDTVYSTFQMTKAATILGAGASAIHLSLYFPKGFVDTALRAANITGTFALVGAVFGGVTNVTATMRGKDDAMNYMAGGCASGVMLGAKMKSFSVGTGSCVAIGLTGVFYKQWMDLGMGKFIKPPIY